MKNKNLLQDRLYINTGNGSFTYSEYDLPDMQSSNSCVSTADIDNDGDLDLFVGGLIIPGSYPIAPRSYVLRNDSLGKFTDITSDICKDLLNPGLVSDAIFTDLNQDFKPDLVIVGEWMKITIFLNKDDHFIESENNGLEHSKGWWNTVSAYDYDGDGDIDLAAGNMGINNSFNASSKQPVRLFYGDFDNNGKIDPIMTYVIDGVRSMAFSRDELIAQVNPFGSNFPDYDSFAKIQEKDLFSILNIAKYDSLIAESFQSSVFLNDGNGRFTIIPMPVEAQFSPVYSIHTMDINNDDYPDLVLGGNQSNTRVSTGKFDALYGLILIGKGDGYFTTLDPVISGIKVIGDMRSIIEIKNPFGDFLLFTLNNGRPVIYKKSL